MRLTEWERDRLLIFSAAELARRHRAAGLLLNAPEATAFICDTMFETARAGATYEQVEAAGRSALTPADVMDGVPALVEEIRLEVMLGDGTRLVVLRDPLRQGAASAEQDVVASPRPEDDRQRTTIAVRNIGQRVIRVSSHYPFEQVNQRLEFDRDAARGFRLDLAAGETVRWAPGEAREVTLVRYGGAATGDADETRR